MKRKILTISIMIALLAILTFSSVVQADSQSDIEVTLEQIDQPNPQAMEAYTQLTGNPNEYMERLYESLERLTE